MGKVAPPKLGRYPSPPDSRDYNLRDFMPKKVSRVQPQEICWPYQLKSLDQGDTGHCVGFSMANFGINLPIFSIYDNKDGHAFYYKCKEVDGDPDSEEGSTIRTAAKVLQKGGLIGAYAFAPSISVIKWWLLNRGPLIVGTVWYSDMFTPDENNVIHPTGTIVGGHAYLITEYRKDGFFGIQNSWGPGWGKNGKAYISCSDFEKIFSIDGEAMTSVEISVPVSEKKPCPLMDIIQKILGGTYATKKGLLAESNFGEHIEADSRRLSTRPSGGYSL